MTTTNNPNKPFTANFELQTKIRVIIQEVLAATIRKLSVFNEKIDKFDEYFMVYKQRVEDIDRDSKQTRKIVNHANDDISRLRKDFNNQIIKSEQTQQHFKIEIDEVKSEVKDIAKQIKQILRQNENLNTELSKTKGKFLEYSNVISGLKEQVSWKITKYIEETAETNTQIKINNEEIKKEYFNTNLMLEKQKERYDKIIEANEKHQNDTKRMLESIELLKSENDHRLDEHHRVMEKIDEQQTQIISKIRTVEGKMDTRVVSLESDNKKAMAAVKKLETFNKQIDDIKNEQQRIRLQTIKKIEETNKKIKDQNQVQIVKVSKEMLKVEKALQKKVSQLQQATTKSEDFLTQKIQFVKMEIEAEMSTQRNKLIKEKQDSSKVNSSTMDQVTSTLNKMNLEIHKQIVKVENSIKEVKSQLKHTISQTVENIQTKIENLPVRSSNQDDEGGTGGAIGKKIIQQLTGKIQQTSTRIESVNHSFQKHAKQTKDQFVRQSQIQGKFQAETKTMIDSYFKDHQEDISRKVEKIMFLVSKMRGDGIIRNEFTDKQIKEIKRNHQIYKESTDTILKLVPAFGECINLIMALIFDAEFQHAKIVQDSNLPLQKKDEEKFNTCLEGILYEFKEKKKSGVIHYRHKQIKKVELVKATFQGYIRVWEGLFQNEFKDKSHLLPKGFYKNSVQRGIVGGLSSRKLNTNNQEPERVRELSSEQIKMKKILSNSPDKQRNSFYQSNGFSKPLMQKNQSSHPQNNHGSESRIPPSSSPSSKKQAAKVRNNKKQYDLELPHIEKGQSKISSSNNSREQLPMHSQQAIKSLKRIEEDEMAESQQKVFSKRGASNGQNQKESISSGSINMGGNNENNLNNSFHIRKKKTVKKDEVMVINYPTD